MSTPALIQMTDRVHALWHARSDAHGQTRTPIPEDQDMTTALFTDRLPSKTKRASLADTALLGAARLWYLTAVAGQLVFALTVAALYGGTAARGDFRAWNRFMPAAHVPGEALGNAAAAAHLLAAVVITLSGAIQLLPRIRQRAPSFHRWNGRLYLLSAVAVSSAGLYLLWTRQTIGDLWQRLGSSLNAVLILFCAAMALRTALGRDFRSHRRWTLRLFLVVSASWMFRVGIALSLLLNKGPFGFDPSTFSGPFLTLMSFGTYLVPLAVLELYFRAQEGSSARGRLAMATGLLGLTVAMGVGIFAATMVFWVPRLEAAFDGRTSIAQTLSDTIAASGVDAAVRQYHDLRAAAPATYNFAERELNSLGYELIRARKFKDAVRVLQLNVEAYPRSSNVYDSLAEAYLSDGDRPRAIANYREVLRIDPNNRGAFLALQRLGAR